MRSCPQHRYGEISPGLIYQPDDRRARPRSAPSYSMRSRQADAGCQRTPAKVAPNSYEGAREASIGVQRDSRRRTARASSFSRSDRFPASKLAEGNLAEECKTVPSVFGKPRLGGKGNSGYNATFGTASRYCATNRVARGEDELTNGRSNRPRMPHPPVAPHPEIIRYGSHFEKSI
jgi:hypothetical protein